jgi:hypothetical protein
MIITVIRSGGFAGISRQWSVRVDEQPDEEQWRELIDRLPWEHSPAAQDEPDRYIYRVRCAPREAVIPEKRLTGPWRELVDKVQVTSKPEARDGQPDG